MYLAIPTLCREMIDATEIPREIAAGAYVFQ
nr:MAG TPA: hypothetical protein [Caudoviricetes sp.]